MIFQRGRFNRCYCTGGVQSDLKKGGFIGEVNKRFSNWSKCFYNKETSGLEQAVGQGNSRGIKALSSEEMASHSTFARAGWKISKNRWPKNVQGWVIDDGKNLPVLAGCMPEGIKIYEVNIKADKDRTGKIGDSFEVKGMLNSANFEIYSDIHELDNEINFSITHNDGENIYGFNSSSDYWDRSGVEFSKDKSVITYKKPVYISQKKYDWAAWITYIQIDLNKSTFVIRGENMDLSGLVAPMTITLKCGQFCESAVVAQTEQQYIDGDVEVPMICNVINIKDDLPIEICESVYDALRVSRHKLKLGRKPGTDSLMVEGEFTMADTTIDMAEEDITMNFGSYSLTLEAENLRRLSGKRKLFRYKTPKGSENAIAAATFDLDKHRYKIVIKKADIGGQAAPVTFSLSFADFDQTVGVLSRN